MGARVCSPAVTVPSTLECSPHGLLKQTEWPPLSGERRSLTNRLPMTVFTLNKGDISNIFKIVICRCLHSQAVILVRLCVAGRVLVKSHPAVIPKLSGHNLEVHLS